MIICFISSTSLTIKEDVFAIEEAPQKKKKEPKEKTRVTLANQEEEL